MSLTQKTLGTVIQKKKKPQHYSPLYSSTLGETPGSESRLTAGQWAPVTTRSQSACVRMCVLLQQLRQQEALYCRRQ